MSIVNQKASLAKVQAIIAVGNDKIASLDPGLRSDARAQRVFDIREAVAVEVAATRKEMQTRQAEAKANLPRWSQEAVRRRAKFSEDPAVDAQQRIAAMETLKRVPTAALQHYLEDAIAENSLAAAEAIRLEFKSRSDASADINERFNSVFSAVVDPVAKTVESELAQIDGLASHAEALIHEFIRGQSNPAARLATARMAGLAA